jgi:hypothetical protein
MPPHGPAKLGRRRARWTARATKTALALELCARVASAAPAAPTPGGHALELSWEAPSGCGNVEDVRRDVERVVGKSGEVQRKVRAHGEVSRTAGAWSVTLTLVTDAGRSTRTLTAPSCRALARASAVVIAFTMTEHEPGPDTVEPPAGADADADEAHTERGRPVEPPHVATPPQPSNEQPPIAPKAASPPSPQAGPTVGAFARADVGTLPGVALGPGVLVGWFARPVLLEGTFGWLAGQDSEIAAPPGRRATISHAEFSAFFVRTAVCPVAPGLSLEGQRLRLFGCAGFGALQTRVTAHPAAGQPSRTEAGTTTEGWSGSLFLGPRLRFTQGWFAMSASVDVALPLRRQEFVLVDRSGGAASVHRSAAALVGLSLSVELSFFQ